MEQLVETYVVRVGQNEELP